jgi:hypothetical protein
MRPIETCTFVSFAKCVYIPVCNNLSARRIISDTVHKHVRKGGTGKVF